MGKTRTRTVGQAFGTCAVRADGSEGPVVPHGFRRAALLAAGVDPGPIETAAPGQATLARPRYVGQR